MTRVAPRCSDGMPDDYASDEEFAAWLAAWPNCAVPDCAYKSCRSLGSPLCHAHTLGLTPPPPEIYFRRWPTYGPTE